MLVDLVGGLCNQLIIILNAIVLGHISKRKVCIGPFKNNYNGNESTPIEKVLDIKNLNNLIDVLVLDTNIETQYNGDEFVDIRIPDDKKVITMNEELNIFILNDANRPIKYLKLGSPFHYNCTDIYILDKLAILKSGITFESYWHELANSIKKEYFVDSFKSIHLRLEDDMIVHLSQIYNRSFDNISTILEHMFNMYISDNVTSNDNIYVCTALCKYKNYNDKFLIDLKKKIY